MEADGAGEQMRPLLTRVRSGEAEARRQRRRRGEAAGGLCGRLRAVVAFVWRGSRGTAGLEPLRMPLPRTRVSAAAVPRSLPRGTGRRVLPPRGRCRPPAQAALPAPAAFILWPESEPAVGASDLWSVESQAHEKDGACVSSSGPHRKRMARERPPVLCVARHQSSRPRFPSETSKQLE